jgi:hypothetical protein
MDMKVAAPVMCWIGRQARPFQLMKRFELIEQSELVERTQIF